MSEGLLFLFQLFGALAGPRRFTHYFLATGATRDTLQQAQGALNGERQILSDIKAHFGARHVHLASPAAIKNWGMESSGGFDIFFKRIKKPEGWWRPDDWDERRNYQNTRQYLPPEGEAQEYLQQAKARFDAIQAGPPGAHDNSTIHDECARSTGDWYYWGNTRARKTLGTPEGFYYQEPVAPGVFVMYFDSKDEKAELPPGVTGIPITKEDADLINGHPDSAASRAARLEQGKKALTVGERSLALVGRQPG